MPVQQAALGQQCLRLLEHAALLVLASCVQLPQGQGQRRGLVLVPGL